MGEQFELLYYAFIQTDNICNQSLWVTSLVHQLNLMTVIRGLLMCIIPSSRPGWGDAPRGERLACLCNLGVVGSAQGWALDVKRIASSLSLNFSQPLQTPPVPPPQLA